MRTKEEIKEQIKRLESQQKKAFCKCEYALFDDLDVEIRTLKWVLMENVSETNDTAIVQKTENM